MNTNKNDFIPICPITPEHPDMLIGSPAITFGDNVTADKESEYARNTSAWD